jgi:hypothetical protein
VIKVEPNREVSQCGIILPMECFQEVHEWKFPDSILSFVSVVDGVIGGNLTEPVGVSNHISVILETEYIGRSISQEIKVDRSPFRREVVHHAEI